MQICITHNLKNRPKWAKTGRKLRWWLVFGILPKSCALTLVFAHLGQTPRHNLRLKTRLAKMASARGNAWLLLFPKMTSIFGSPRRGHKNVMLSEVVLLATDADGLS